MCQKTQKKINREHMISIISDTKVFCHKWGFKKEASILDDDNIDKKDYNSLYKIYVNAIDILFSSDLYKRKMKNVSEKAWEYIFSNTSLIRKYTIDKYNVSSSDDILQALMIGEYEEIFGMNPLDFDTWEEFLEKLVGFHSWSLELVDNGGYHEYKEGRVVLSPKIVEPIWSMMEEEAKQHYRNGLYKLDYSSEIVECIMKEIKDILKNKR